MDKEDVFIKIAICAASALLLVVGAIAGWIAASLY